MSDVHWFDEFHKAAINEISRRRVAQSLAALLPVLLSRGTAVGAKRKKGGKRKGKGKGNNHRKPNKPHKPKPPKPPETCELTCPEGRICCNGECCKTGTAGTICCEGRCIPLSDGYGQCCDGAYVWTWNDPEHCGYCGNPCGPHEECVHGQCVCSETRRASAAGDASSCDDCPAGQTRCGGVCVDTKWNQTHCGGCYAANPDNLLCCNGELCPSGMPCVGGVCTCGSYNYCHHRDLGWICASDDCSLIE